MTIEAGDITKLPYAGEFDAVIGRLIVLYLGDPVAGMKAFRSYVKPGGLIYFQEFGQPQMTSIPPVPLYDQARQWIEEAFAARQDRALYGDASRRTVSRGGPAGAVDAGDERASKPVPIHPPTSTWRRRSAACCR